MLSYPFMVHAFLAGTIVSIVAGALGWFMVLRHQTFAGHTLSVVSFPGAAGAILIGISPAVGLFASSCGAGLAIGLLGRHAGSARYTEESAIIGTIQAFALGCGFLFVSLYGGNLNGLTGLLFGTFLGVTSSQVLALLVLAVPTMLALALVARPLILASVEPDVAAATGVPVRFLGVGSLLLLGVAVAEASQITGSLLVFALLVLPPATAHAVTGRPGLGVAMSVAVALAVTWVGLIIAYSTPFPTGAIISTLSFGAYLGVRAVRVVARRSVPRSAPVPGEVMG
jgi:zinc/manganese transport system permease protein